MNRRTVIVTTAAVVCAAWGAGPCHCQDVATGAPPMQERRATVVLKVDNYSTARDGVLKAAAAEGAAVLGGQTEVTPKGKKHGWVDFETPAARFGALIQTIRPIGKLYADRVTSADHSSEYEELARRSAQLEQHQARLLKLLDSHQLRGSDILYILDRANRAGIDQALLLQRRADLERMGRSSEIMVELFEPGAAPASNEPSAHMANLRAAFTAGLSRARAAVGRVLSRAATGLAFAMVFAPIWIPVLLVTTLSVRWLFRRVVPAVIASCKALSPTLSQAVRSRATLIGAAAADRRTRRSATRS